MIPPIKVKSKMFSVIIKIIVVTVIVISIYFISYGYSGIIFVSNTFFVACTAIFIKNMLFNQKRVPSIIVFFLLLPLLFNAFKIYFITSSPKTAVSFTCKKNFEKIANALIKYFEIHGKMPPVKLEKNGCNEFTDWRTSILPFFDDEHDFPRCPDDQSIYPSYVAIIGKNTIWNNDFIQPNTSPVAILIEVNNKYNVQRNEYGDVHLDDILSGNIKNNFFCKTHHSSDIFFRYSTFRVLMQNGEILYFYDLPSNELFSKLFTLDRRDNGLSEYSHSKDFHHGAISIDNIILACVYYVLIAILLPIVFRTPELVQDCPCPTSVRSPENEDLEAVVVQEVSSDPKPPDSASTFGEKSEKEQN